MFNSDWRLSINSKTFDVLDISLFKNHRFTTLMSYIIFVWVLTTLKVLLIVSDIYTCIKLLAFNSWSNNIVAPYIPFHISKWLFSGCILASIVLVIWEVINGIRIYRTRNISLTYVNNFSRSMYSLFQYRIFCIYNKITPRGFYQRVAFFTFFELKDCVRLLFTDTPRQVINGLTLWSTLVTVDHDSNLGHVENFKGLITKIKTIAQTNHEEAVVLSFMLFSFAIWAIFITKLLVACLCSIYVYYRIFQDHRMSGLKEFVCVTISDNVDYLTEKYRKKKDRKDVYKRGILLDASVPDLNQVEAGWFDEPAPPIINASTTELLKKTSTENTLNSLSGSPPLPFKTAVATESVESLPENSEVLNPTSPINGITQHNTNLSHKRIAFDPIKKVQTFDLAYEFAPKLNKGQTFNSIATSDTTPSYYYNRADDRTDIGFNARRNFTKQLQINENIPLEDVSIRPTLDQDNSFDLAYEDKETDSSSPLISNFPERNASLPKTNFHVDTPARAYFNEYKNSDKDKDGDNASFLDSFPQRTTSLLNRRDRIENEDYEIYVQRMLNGGR